MGGHCWNFFANSLETVMEPAEWRKVMCSNVMAVLPVIVPGKSCSGQLCQVVTEGIWLNRPAARPNMLARRPWLCMRWILW